MSDGDRDPSLRERLQKVLETALAELARDDAPSRRIADDAVRGLAATLGCVGPDQSVRPLPSFVDGLIKEAGRRHAQRTVQGNAVFGLPSGLNRLDTVLGGFQPGLHFLAARPGIGKTTFSLQLARNMAKTGTPVLFASFEERADRLALKALCASAGLNAKQYQDGLADAAELRAAADAHGASLSLLRFFEGRPRTAPADIYAHVAELLAETGGEQCFIIVDYIQLWGRGRAAGGDPQRVVTDLASELREYLVGLLHCPVLCISAQSRNEGEEGYQMALRSGGDLEYDADTVMYLKANDQRTEEIGILKPGATTRAIDLVIEKNRYGDTGPIELVLRPELGLFREVAFAKGKESFTGERKNSEAPRGLRPAYMRDEA